MKIQIQFHTDNASFKDNWQLEIDRIMCVVKAAIATGDNHRLIDINGNTIGTVSVSNKTQKDSEESPEEREYWKRQELSLQKYYDHKIRGSK